MSLLENERLFSTTDQPFSSERLKALVASDAAQLLDEPGSLPPKKECAMAIIAIRHVLVIASVLACSSALAQVTSEQCGDFEGHYGPYDYRADKDGDPASHAKRLNLVEGAHFLPRIETLISSKSGGGPPGGDINYTLKAFPNHHRALIAVMNYEQKTNSRRPPGLQWDVECYFERAIRFKRDDPIVFMIYAIYLNKHKREKEAISQLERASAVAGNSPFTHHNIGMVYLDMKIYDKALAKAHQAIELGLMKSILRDRLAQEGKWQEPSVQSQTD